MTDVVKFIRTLIKGGLLLLWIVSLVSLAVWAARGKASNEIMSYQIWSDETSDISTGNTEQIYQSNASGYQFLEAYFDESRSSQDKRMPIGALLDRIVPGWDTRFEGIELEVSFLRREHYNLFRKIEQRLNAISRNKSIDASTITIKASLVSSKFGGPVQSAPAESVDSFSLPLEAVLWIVEDRKDQEFRKARSALIDTFLMLIVLGAFGSMIFLTREYITAEENTPVSAFIFRPILGMFLAMAMFILDILAHALISNAEYVEVRYETLYVLAFAAGLLSEQTYSAVRIKAQAMLERFEEKAQAQ